VDFGRDKGVSADDANRPGILAAGYRLAVGH